MRIKSKIFVKVKQTYADSEIYGNPIWFGYRNGNNVIRIGYSHPVVQDVTQNGWHLLTKVPLLYTPYGKYSSRYNYNGYYSPFSLYY